MKCQTCLTDNPTNPEVCEFCGQRMQQTCPYCRSENSPHFRYCGVCGNILPASTSGISSNAKTLEAKLNVFRRYLPRELGSTILAGKHQPIEAERKHVTIMFCDISGFTALTESFGADSTFSLMDKIFTILVNTVSDFQGVVNEFRGDGILAFFGAPFALEDAPQRAIRSALAIHRAIARFSQGEMSRKEPGLAPVLLRIGINTGLVVVGNVGNDQRLQYTAMGEAINIASRIEQIALPGTIYVSEQTFKLTEGLFRFEDAGIHHFKGKRDPLRVYRVISTNARRTRFDVNAERGLTPLAGRQHELRQLLDGFRRVRQGHGQVLFVVSEAGMGKSRLLYEFRKLVTNESVIFVEGRNLSYSGNTPYHLIIDILRSVFHLDPATDHAEQVERIEKTLRIVSQEYRSALPHILELLSINAGAGSPADKISPEAKRERIIAILKHMVIKGCERQPLVLACEDLHWMDANSGEALQQIMEIIDTLPVLLVFTFRSEFKIPWQHRPHHHTITLERLTSEENLQIARAMLDQTPLCPQLAELIQIKTEGNPFFTEEFIRTLLDLKIIAKRDYRYVLQENIGSVLLPSTIHDVIMARVDALSPEAKEILQIGSAIEREVPLPLLCLVSGQDAVHLNGILDTLTSTNLIHGFYDDLQQELIYVFKHALTREVIYDSITSSRKKQLHNRIGTCMEILHHDRLGEMYTVLCHHFLSGENYQLAANYAHLAGKQAQKRSSYQIAISYGRLCVDCLEKLPQTPEIQKNIVEARTSTANYCMGINHHTDAMQAVEPVVALARELGCSDRLAQILVATGSYKVFACEQFEEGIAELIEAKMLAIKYGDPLAYWYSVFFLGSIYWLEGMFEDSQHHFELSLTQSEKTNSISGQCFSICSMSAWPLGYDGRLSLGLEQSSAALTLAIASNDIFVQQCAYSSLGCCMYLQGLIEPAREHLLKGNELYENACNIFWGTLGQLWLGELHLHIGEYATALHYFKQSRNTIERRKVLPSWSLLTEAKSTQCLCRLDNVPVDLARLPRLAKANRIKINDSIIANSIADILMQAGKAHFDHAEHWLNRAITFNRTCNNRWRLAGDYVLYARLAHLKGEDQKSREHLATAISIYAASGADGWAARLTAES